MLGKQVRWPLGGVPTVIRADRFPHADRHFEAAYQQVESWALHVYDYHGVMRLNDHEFELAPRTLSLTPIGWTSRYHLPRQGYHWCVHFAPPEAEGDSVSLPLFQSLGDNAGAIIKQLTDIARLQALSFRQGAAGRTAGAAAGATLQALLLQLALFPAADDQQVQRTAADAAVEQVLVIINERLNDELRVGELAQEVGLSQNYLARCFRQQFGVTIPHYILQRRVDVARQLLRETDLLVKRVAAQVGMPDPQHFNKQFRRFTGMSPTAYRAHTYMDTSH